MEELDEEFDFSSHHKTTFLSLTPSPCPSSNRRLSSQFSQPSRPVPADKALAWVSLQGRIVNAEEASSARAIGLKLSPDELMSWEMFSPIHRILLVAVISVAVAESRKNHEIKTLTQAVELRDQILLNMQLKLDNLCDLVNYEKDQFFMKNAKFQLEEVSYEKLNLADGYKRSSFGSLGKLNGKVPSWDDMIQYELPVSYEAEQEERRMSGLSDWGSSAVSSAEIQMSTLALEEDIYHLNRECQEKEATIKELSDLLQSSDRAGSKRVAELEETVRRKNMTITKLKKDMAVLEQKVMYLTRTRRPSFQNSSSKTKQQLFMTDNVIYDMDSTTSHSSSDSDFSVENSPPIVSSRRDNVGAQSEDLESKRNQKFTALKSLGICTKSVSTKYRPVDPLIDNVLLNGRSKSRNNTFGRTKQSSATVDIKASRKQSQAEMKDTAKEKRRVVLTKRRMTNLE